jgi:excisionase family DNA binding protein
VLTETQGRELLTVKEAAAELRVHPMTVRRMIALGRVPAVQLGGPGTAVRIDRAELHHWLEERKR